MIFFADTAIFFIYDLKMEDALPALECVLVSGCNKGNRQAGEEWKRHAGLPLRNGKGGENKITSYRRRSLDLARAIFLAAVVRGGRHADG